MNIPKIEEAITLLYQTFIEDQDVATQRGIAITAMNEMVKLLGGDDVVKKIEAAPYSARLRAQHLFENEPQPKQEQDKIVQVTIKDFVKAVEGKEHLMGRPVYWAQWPNGNTTPQPRTWVDLTGEELETLLRENRSLTLGAIWAVADKLKEKNCS